jgi:outer membrane biosynthesis protein TonB
MLGKIAKRANSKGPTITAFGKAADQGATGGVTTQAAIGSLHGVATQAGNGGDTYKVGGVGTFGKGGGTGRGLSGVGGLATGGAGTGTVGILDEETEIEGGLDKEVIARIIANYLGEIRYCYERQLSADPDIYGKVQVKFTIDENGGVSDHRIGNTTLNSAMVEGCILRRLARWKFPKPKGGTHVLVSYPFMFKATN